MIKKLLIAVIFIAFVTTSSFGFWTVSCENFINNTRVTTEITIPKKNGFNVFYEAVFKDLDTPFFFRLYLTKVKKTDINLKYGYYKVSDVSLSEFLEIVTTGKQSDLKITFPEGYNTYDMANRISRFLAESGDDFILLTKDREFIMALTGQPLDSLEGYLYPNTYSFPPYTTSKQIIKTMYWLFNQQLPPNIGERAAELGMTVNEIITLASIIQKETYDAQEAPIISSVYHNRLRKNMRLQADPTVIYGLLPDFDGNLTKSQLRDASNPYNTYKMKGLPPTPICNPTKMAIEAALYPADTDYLFFVADNSGRHTFSVDYKDQINNVNKFQKQ